MNQIKLSLIALIILFLGACREDAIIDVEVMEEVQIVFYDTDIQGIAVNPSGVPIEGASINIDGNITNTDENGFFNIQNVQASNTGVFVSAQKPGYFTGGKSVLPNHDGGYTTSITLNPMDQTTNFSTDLGINMELSGGAKVKIPSNAISIDGNPYVGDVTISSIWLDPSKEETIETMPGNLIGITSDQETSVLETFGMIAVEMISEDGKPLNLTEGVKAQLEFPIPSSLQSSAADKIVLWHFDESTGLWIEEGEATRIGNSYMAEVGHFSWWNCDVPNQATLLCINFITKNKEPINLDYLEVVMSGNGFGVATDYISNSSAFCAAVPRDVLLEAKLYSFCGQLIHSEFIGPFEELTEDIVITINNDDMRTISVDGNVTNCEDNPTSDGYVKISREGRITISGLDDTGAYNLNFIQCLNDESEFTIEAVDLENLKKVEVTEDIIDTVDQYTVNLKACEEEADIDPIFTYGEFNQQSISNQICQARVTAAETLIISEEVLLGINGFEEGTFTGNMVGVGIDQSISSSLNSTTITISQYGDVGELIIGTFENATYSGLFVAERIQ